MKRNLGLRDFNNFLTVIVAALGIYIAITPLLPHLTFWLQDKSPEARAPYSGQLAVIEGSTTDQPAPTENRIVIPSIQLDQPILESSNIGVINNGGTWRRPNTALPTEDDNTVIVGHRFYQQDVSTFYHLDKVKPGDLIAVYWDNEEMLYEVVQQKVVEATAIEIENSTTDKTLTIYTCDPVWTAKNRLVLIAKPYSGANS